MLQILLIKVNDVMSNVNMIFEERGHKNKFSSILVDFSHVANLLNIDYKFRTCKIDKNIIDFVLCVANLINKAYRLVNF